MIISNDEWRLVLLSRCLTAPGRYDLMFGLGEKLFEQFCPNETVYDFMPELSGVDPTRDSSHDEIVRAGIEQSGDPIEVLLGISEWDTEGPIDGFVRGATEVADRQGSYFSYDKQFAAEYLHWWRWKIVGKIMSRANVADPYTNPADTEPNSIDVQIRKD